MKKILIFSMLALSGHAYAANSDWAAAIARDFGNPHYLVDAANAWQALIGSPWRGGQIAKQMNEMHNSNHDARMYEVLSTLAYNHTTMTIAQAEQYMNYAFEPINGPLAARRGDGAQNFDITARGIGAYSDFDGNKNNNFKFRTGGAGVQASAYVTDGYVFGIGYTYADSRSKDTPIKMKATSNIISMYSKYLSRGGFYINSVISGGQIQWDADKRAVGVENDTSYNSDIWGGAINTGVLVERGQIFIRPQIGVQYIRLSTEHYTDAAAQSFKKWWYNTMNAGGDVQMGVAFDTSMFTIAPRVTLGAGYDIIHNGTDNIRVGVITGQHYDIPVSGLGRTTLRGGLGVAVRGGAIVGDIAYTLDSRADYISHNVTATLKIAF